MDAGSASRLSRRAAGVVSCSSAMRAAVAVRQAAAASARVSARARASRASDAARSVSRSAPPLRPGRRLRPQRGRRWRRSCALRPRRLPKRVLPPPRRARGGPGGGPPPASRLAAAGRGARRRLVGAPRGAAGARRWRRRAGRPARGGLPPPGGAGAGWSGRPGGRRGVWRRAGAPGRGGGGGAGGRGWHDRLCGEAAGRFGLPRRSAPRQPRGFELARGDVAVGLRAAFGAAGLGGGEVGRAAGLARRPVRPGQRSRSDFRCSWAFAAPSARAVASASSCFSSSRRLICWSLRAEARAHPRPRCGNRPSARGRPLGRRGAGRAAAPAEGARPRRHRRCRPARVGGAASRVRRCARPGARRRRAAAGGRCSFPA